MHQDQRVGLALGILLVGACAAFFFRNETHAPLPAQQLQHAQDLDDRIAERATRPYLKGIQAVETADKRLMSPSVDPAHSGDVPDDPFFTDRDSSDGKFTRNKPRFLRPGASSTESTGDVLELAPIAIPGDGRTNAEVATSSETRISQSGTSRFPGDSANSRTYVVQKGDTLSSIAAKTLGSSHRFQELFEANHDQLHDPNDVKIGMTLRIPECRAESQDTSAYGRTHAPVSRDPEPSYSSQELRDSTSSSIDSNLAPPSQREILLPPDLPSDNKFSPPSESDPSDDSGSSRKFVPARRVPLPGRPGGPQAQNSHRELGGRKLTQATLESTSGKMAR